MTPDTQTQQLVQQMREADHERIWLEPRSAVDVTYGRTWCYDKIWPDEEGDEEPTEYVRADLLEAANARADAAEAKVGRLLKVLRPFKRLWAMPAMGIIESEKDVLLRGEGGNVAPPFNLIRAIRRAALASEVSS